MIQRYFSTKHAALLVRIFLFSGAMFLFHTMHSQPPQLRMYTYIEKYAKEAVHQMTEYKIPASVILAQAIFESRSGTSELAKKSNNHFGIKCHLEWGGDTIVKTDDTLNECFRRYKSIEDSYTDHSLFLSSRARYAHLFDLSIFDYKGWCRGLKNAGYATYATYAEELIRLIETEKLYEFDGPEHLAPSDLSCSAREIVPSALSPDGFTIGDFSKTGLLWLEEKDVVIRSLDMMMEAAEDSSADIAGSE